MSHGHKHRYPYVKYSFIWKILSAISLFYTNDTKRAMQSRFVYADNPGGKFFAWRLGLLGFLHGVCGLTLKVDDD